MSTGQECLHHGRRHVYGVEYTVLDKVTIEQAEGPLLIAETTVQGSLVLDEKPDGFGERTAERRVSGPHHSASPSPRATFRSVSISTLV
jgi:hypothetical protein